jgi:glutathione synthase/RimK-type ligase-like ATP-grasp enzyme
VKRLPGIGWRQELLSKRADQVDRLRFQADTLSSQLQARERTVAELQEKLRKAQAARKRAQERLAVDRPEVGDTTPPSFRRNLINLRRDVELLRTVDPEVYHPLLQIPRKLRNYRLAASHGVAVPEVLGVWGDLGELDLSGMPERFVLKSELGAGGHGVFPLRRLDCDRFALIGGDTVHTRESLIEAYRAKTSTSGPWFAEGFLVQREAGEEIPDDIKVYASYGEVTMVLLRRMSLHADLNAARYRYVTGRGADLGADIAPGQKIDPTIPLPQPFEELIKVAEHLSRAVALPFIRVDIYDTVDGPVFGELTRTPGGRQRYRRDHDIVMGHAWDEARWRLDMDVINGRPLRNLHGLHPHRNYYPEDHLSHSADPKGWEVVSADCSQWCFGGALPQPRE